MDIGAFKAVTKPLVVDFDGEVINLTYRPNIYTLGFTRKMMEARDSEDFSALAQSFVEFLASWDLMEGDQVIPLTTEGVERVPFEILAAIEAQIAETLRPSEEEKRGSSEPSASPPPASTSPSPSSQSAAQTSSNGSETSESQTVSAVDPTS